MRYLKLRLSMLGSLALITGLTTVGFVVLLNGVFQLSFIWTFVLLVPFFLLQWIYAPKLIEYSMNVEPAPPENYGVLHGKVEEICKRVDLEKPELMIARVELPNAFAYGNSLSGYKVAVTEGLLENLEEEEVDAVLGHELGHLKHSDTQITMFLSILPALFMMIGRALLWSSMFGGRRRRNGAPILLVALGAMFFYFLLNLCILWFSRLREYYADEFSASVVQDGSRKLQEALAKIHRATAELKEGANRGGGTPASKGQNAGLNPFSVGIKPLFITDPDVDIAGEKLSDRELVEKYKDQGRSLGQRLFEIFTTHPELSKRLKALDQFR